MYEHSRERRRNVKKGRRNEGGGGARTKSRNLFCLFLFSPCFSPPQAAQLGRDSAGVAKPPPPPPSPGRRGASCCQSSPTEHFTILELKNLPIDKFYVIQKCPTADFEAIKLRNVRSDTAGSAKV